VQSGRRPTTESEREVGCRQTDTDLGLVADVEGQKVRLSAKAAVAVTFEEERSGDFV